MRTITVQPGATINLGQQYDNEATEVIFPASLISKITDVFGLEGIFYIWYIRNGDNEGYPIGSPLVTYSDGQVRWTITEAEVANPGPAQVQLRYIALDFQVMSKVFRAMVYNSVDIGDDVPEPMEPWADAIIEALNDVHEVPAGGTTGQVLAKASDDDYDLEWTDQSGGGGAVDSVNGQTGVVILDAADVGAIPKPVSATSGYYLQWDGSAWAPAAAPVTSVNGSTGAVSLTIPATAGDVGAIPAPSSPVSGQFLSWNGSAWVAADLPLYNGGVI